MLTTKCLPSLEGSLTTTRYPRVGISRRVVRVAAGFGDGLRKFFDDMAFEKWAPRSSRTWRLSLPPKDQQQVEKATNETSTNSSSLSPLSLLFLAELWDSLEEEIKKEYEKEEPQVIDEEESIVGSSFMDSTDEEVNDSLRERIQEIAENNSDTIPQTPLTGMELRRLIFAKYKRTYDVSFARRDIWGKTLVSLNIMWSYLEQGSFPMSEAQLMVKYERTAAYLNTWGQAEQVRGFLTSPPKSKGGLPSRPIIGVAVSFQLDLPPHIINEWFGRP